MTPEEREVWHALERRLRAELLVPSRRGGKFFVAVRRWLWNCLDAYARAYFPSELVGRIDLGTSINLSTNVPFPP